jgi:predicted transcriptional regulator
VSNAENLVELPDTPTKDQGRANMSKQSLSPLSDAQREIMELIWDRGELAVVEVQEILGKQRNVARNTVQTLLVRMEEKGWLKHRTVGRTFFYSAAQPRSEVRTNAVSDLLQSLFLGSAEEMAAALLENVSLTPAEAERIRAMIDDAERRRKKKPS